MLCGRSIATIICLVGVLAGHAAAAFHLGAHKADHVHAADGGIVPITAARELPHDTRALFYALEHRHPADSRHEQEHEHEHDRAPAPAGPTHEASGLAHFAAPLLVAFAFALVVVVEAAPLVVDVALPPFRPLEDGRRHDSRGPPSAHVT